MEGVASEAASLAGHLRLGKLVYLYDDNRISIDGTTDLTFTEDVGRRFEAYGWHVEAIDGHDLAAIDLALDRAKAEAERPSLVMARTHIGLDSPLQDSAAVHGAALGPENVQALKEKLGWPAKQPFHVPEEALDLYREAVPRGRQWREAWNERRRSWAATRPREETELERVLAGTLPDDLEPALPTWGPDVGRVATRKASGAVLQGLAARLPELVGGSADLTGSNNTFMKETGLFGTDAGGRNVHYGVREHAMAAAANGLALHGLRPFVGTFLIFSDYLRPSLRLAAMAGLRVVYVFTHDSIGLGEDGPTHQPVEQLPSLRAVPGLVVVRPADANETREGWLAALERSGPTVLALSRQGLPVLERPAGSDARRGAYVLREARGGAPRVLLLASGSEVAPALAAADLLEADGGPPTRVVSMPSWELFAGQPEEYRRAVLPPAVRARVAVEAARPLGWERWVGEAGEVVALDRFGASAPADVAFRELGFTPEAVAAAAHRSIAAAGE
jgi:transketolase